MRVLVHALNYQIIAGVVVFQKLKMAVPEAISFADEYNRTILHCFTHSFFLLDLVDNVLPFFENSERIGLRCAKTGFTALMFAIHASENPDLALLILKKMQESSPDAIGAADNSHGRTSLHWAALHMFPDVIEALLSCISSEDVLHRKDKHGFRALDYVFTTRKIHAKQIDIAERFRRKIDYREWAGHSKIEVALRVLDKTSSKYLNDLQSSSWLYEMIKNKDDNKDVGRTLLHYAAIEGFDKVYHSLQPLFGRKGLLNVKDHNGMTAADYFNICTICYEFIHEFHLVRTDCIHPDPRVSRISHHRFHHKCLLKLFIQAKGQQPTCPNCRGYMQGLDDLRRQADVWGKNNFSTILDAGGDPERIKRALDSPDAEALVSVSDEQGHNALYYLVHACHEAVACLVVGKMRTEDVMVKFGASRKTILHYAAEIGFSDLVDAILSRLDSLGEAAFRDFLFAVDSDHGTALDYALEEDHEACACLIVGKMRFQDVAKFRFLEDPDERRDPGDDPDFQTILHVAAAWGSTKLVEAVFSRFHSLYGLDSTFRDFINAPDRDNQTALDYALDEGHSEAIACLIVEKMLIKSSAAASLTDSKREIVEKMLMHLVAVDPSHRTILHRATWAGYPTVVDTFLSRLGAAGEPNRASQRKLTHQAAMYKPPSAEKVLWLKQSDYIICYADSDRRTALHYALQRMRSNDLCPFRAIAISIANAMFSECFFMYCVSTYLVTHSNSGVWEQQIQSQSCKCCLAYVAIFPGCQAAVCASGSSCPASPRPQETSIVGYKNVLLSK